MQPEGCRWQLMLRLERCEPLHQVCVAVPPTAVRPVPSAVSGLPSHYELLGITDLAVAARRSRARSPGHRRKPGGVARTARAHVAPWGCGPLSNGFAA